jgi:hypothetical protein
VQCCAKGGTWDAKVLIMKIGEGECKAEEIKAEERLNNFILVWR